MTMKMTNSNKYMEEAFIQKQARVIAESKYLIPEEKLRFLNFLKIKN